MIPSELLADPKHWTKGSYSRDADGNRIRVHSLDAVSFCLVGACCRCDVPIQKLREVVLARGFESIVRFNDDPSIKHSDVLSVLKEVGL